MKKIKLFRSKREDEVKTKEEINDEKDLETLLRAELSEDKITKEMALNIPSLSACVDFIGNTIAMCPINLIKKDGNKKSIVTDDPRVKMLNYETGDTLDAFQFKKAIIDDYLLMGNAYVYINREKGFFKSLHYVDESRVSINNNYDPIFKDYSIIVDGKNYRPFEFLTILRNSKNGSEGQGIVEANKTILSVAYNSLIYENKLSKTGGNKKGFIKSTNTLGEKAITELKRQWNRMYSGNSENCVVLNKGLDFQESSITSTEMQLNENKKTNGIEICKILNVSPSILEGDGKANAQDFENTIKKAVLPPMKAIITALNRDLILEKEKGSYFFAFDIKELLKGDIEKRYKAFEIGLKNGFLFVNDVRTEENLEEIEALDGVVKLGLNDVLFNTKTNEIYTPNTDKTTNLKGGENANED